MTSASGRPRERQLHTGPIGAIGVDRADLGDRLGGGAFGWPLIVLPRLAVEVAAAQAGETVIADATSVVLYNDGEVARVRYLQAATRMQNTMATRVTAHSKVGVPGWAERSPAAVRILLDSIASPMASLPQ